LSINHYWKNLTQGPIKTAQAFDLVTGQVIYEVVYSEIIDDQVKQLGQSVSKEKTLPYPVTLNDSTVITTVYPNSLINMRDQVIDVVGQTSSILPLWMTSKQANGQVLGFVPAWVIAYVKPGESQRVSYNIRTRFETKINAIDFKVDRYELDALLTLHWDTATQTWDPTPPTCTTFDLTTNVISNWTNNALNLVNWQNNSNVNVGWYNTVSSTPTIFDGGSMQFIDPVDMYSNSQEYDKYLVFPKRTILG
jgi:hypothetical protein